MQARNETGYVFVWTYSAGWFDEIAQGRLPVSTQRLQEVAGDLSLVMQTDESGVPQRLLNRDEAVGVFKRVLDELLKQKPGEPPPPPEVAEVVAMFTKPEVVESLLLRSAQVFYFACGAALAVGEAIEFTDALPNPFGGDPFPEQGEHRAVGAPPRARRSRDRLARAGRARSNGPARSPPPGACAPTA